MLPIPQLEEGQGGTFSGGRSAPFPARKNCQSDAAQENGDVRYTAVKKRHTDHKKPSHKVVSIPAAELVVPDVPELHATDHMIHLRAEALQRGVLHDADRSEMEERVLRFLAHALDPTALGVARLLGQKPEDAGVLLGALAEAGLVWQQATGEAAAGWHLSLEGQRYLTQRGISPEAPPRS
jgi:hypothetical protein